MEMGIFYIKILGNGCILLSGSLLGWMYSRNLQKQYEELHQWKQNIISIYGQVSYGGATFREIIGQVVMQNEGVFLTFFQTVEHGMTKCYGKQLHEIWREAGEKTLEGSHLTQEEKDEIIGIGRKLGKVDKEQQLAFLQLHIDRMDYLIGVLEKDKDKKMKLYKMMGVLGSIFIIVLLM